MSEATRRRFTVLVVEDDPGDSRLVRGYLAETSGVIWDIECVEQLAAAVERLPRGGIDVVLLDLRLPDSIAVQTVERVCAAAPDLPVVVLTGLGDELIGLQALRSGAQDFLVKGRGAGPLLVRVLRHAVERTRARAGVQEAAKRIDELRAGHLAAVSRLEPNDPGRAELQKAIESLDCLQLIMRRTLVDLGFSES